MKFIPFALCSITFAFSVASCGNSSEQEVKKAWTEAQKKEFKDNCFMSTRFSFEQMGKKLEAAQINTICDCTARELESKYNYKAATRIPKAEVQSILKAVLEKCAPDMMSAPTTDSLAPAR